MFAWGKTLDWLDYTYRMNRSTQYFLTWFGLQWYSEVRYYRRLRQSGIFQNLLANQWAATSHSQRRMVELIAIWAANGIPRLMRACEEVVVWSRM